MTNEQNLCLGCDFINDGKWCEYFRQVTIYRDSCEGFRPKATEESNSSSMACSIAPTSKAPEKAGFYWFHAGGRGAVWSVVPVYLIDESIRDGISGYRFGAYEPGVAVEMVSREARWAGPLNPPKQ